jgi:carbonic anhydrase
MNSLNLYQKLLENNQKWVEEKLNLDNQYFENLSKGQSPKFLFIGCSDSRVPAEEITGSEPGEMFIHRNVANLVVNTDLNVHSVIEYAVEVLKVEHIIVCGHYGCGGVKAAMSNHHFGLIDKWLRNIKDIYRIHKDELSAIEDEKKRFDRLVELNVIEQVHNLYKSYVIQKAWNKEADIHIHGWVYDIREGLIRDLKVSPDRDFDFYDEIFDLDFEK